MAEQNKLQEMIRTSLESLRAMVDANTVVGTPINTPSGTTIIPISKVSVGYASGGLDFGAKSAAKNFGGGGGTGLTVSPVCFLAVNAEGGVEVFPVGGMAPRDSLERAVDLVERTPEILSRIKAVFQKNKSVNDDVVDEVVQAVTDAVTEAVESTESNL